MKVSYTRNGTEYSVEVESLPPKSVEYLLQYGWSQSLQDAIAGDAKRIKDEMIAKADAAGETAPTSDEIEAAVKAGLDEALADRVKSISDGTVGDRVGIVRNPFETACRDLAEKKLVEGFRASNQKLPDRKTDAGRAKYKEFVVMVLDRNREVIEKEVKAAMAREKKIVIELPTM
jgi:hypothetical protein